MGSTALLLLQYPLFSAMLTPVSCHRLPKGGNPWAPSSDLYPGIFMLLPQVNSANFLASTVTFSILDECPDARPRSLEHQSPPTPEHSTCRLRSSSITCGHFSSHFFSPSFWYGLPHFTFLYQGPDSTDALSSLSFGSNYSLVHYRLDSPLIFFQSPYLSHSRPV